MKKCYLLTNISHPIGVFVSNYKLVYLKAVTSNEPVSQVINKAHKHHEKDNKNEFGSSGRFPFKCVIIQEGSIINNIYYIINNNICWETIECYFKEDIFCNLEIGNQSLAWVK